MKSYLSLIPISAKVRRRQNRLTLLCILFSVFMVTAVFSMAEMGARMELARLSEKHGSFSLQDLFDSAMGQSLFLAAIVLFLLILVAGVLMIASSINSSVAQRTRAFGMMRCIGMSRRQIIRFVRLEALNWCKTAIPVGIGLGVAATWGLCAALRFLVGEEFADIPLFGVSVIGIVSGVLEGIAAVLLAAGSPAKRAAKVSPVTAASGNAQNEQNGQKARHGTKLRFFKVETALGIHHAMAAKKNLAMMTASFALSIVLFLSFSVLVDWVDHVMPQSAAASDLDISSRDGSNSIDRELIGEISGMEGAEHVYGRRSGLGISVDGKAGNSGQKVDLVSYDDFDLDCLEKDDILKRGSDLSKVYGNSHFVLAAWDPGSSLGIGDKIRVCGEELEIAGLLKYDPFSGDGLTKGKTTLITSGETFVRLTGESGYSLVQIQMAKDAADKNVEAIRNKIGGKYAFHDKRDESTSGTYMAFVSCVYAFLGIIALVTVLNIINSISMSVSARIKQYGAMRAVGMAGRQVTKMIAAEAFTYALLGCAAGCAAGIPLNKLLYDSLITGHFSYAVWELPAASLGIILLFVLFAAAAAAYAPARRMASLSVTETISEL